MAKRKFDYNTRPTGKDIQPFVDEFLAQNNAKQWLDVNKYQRYRFYDSVIPRIKKFLKESKGLIRRQEMAELLGVPNDYLRAIGKSQAKSSTGKPNVRYKLFQDILGPVKKIYRPITGQNEGFYKKPTKSQIENFKKTARSATILPVMQERVNAFVNNKKFMNMLKKDALSDPAFLTKAQAMFPKLDLTSQKLAEGILYIARGSKGDEFIGTNIKKNLPLHKRLINQFETATWGNPFHAAGYKFAQAEIDNQLGAKSGTFRGYQEALRDAFKSAGFKNLKNYQVDEIVGTSIGGKQQFAPYSVFSRFLSKEVNAGPAASYQGALSRASTRLTGIIDEFGPNSKQAVNFVKDFNKNQASLFEKRHGIKAARLDLRMPEQVFGKKRFAELGTLGEQMTDVVKQKGFGFQLPKGALTQKELLVNFANKNTSNICQIFGKADGGRIGFKSGGAGCGVEMAQALDEDPVGTATKIQNIKTEGGVNRIKPVATGFLNFLKSPGVKSFTAAGVAGAVGSALVKEFRNDDPSTYLSNEDQQKSMLVAMATDPITDDFQRPDILDYQLPLAGALVAGSTVAVAPKTIKASKARGFGIEQKRPGVVKTGFRTLGRGLGVAASPGLLAPLAAMDIGSQISEGDSPLDIATDPLNYLYPAFSETTPRFTRGLPSVVRKAASLGLGKTGLRLLSRAGIVGLGLSLGIQGYNLLNE